MNLPEMAVNINGDLGVKDWRSDPAAGVTQRMTLDEKREVARRVNAYPKLMEALRALLVAAETRPVLAGDGVKAVREAGKFMKAIDTARAVLAECEEA